MERVIRDVGYEVPWDRTELLVLGMMGTHCQSIIEKAVGAMPGVVRAAVNLGTDSLSVEYAGAVVSAGQIKKTIRVLGYQVSEKGEGESALDRERRPASGRSVASS
jgi:Cu+-exporting ATPase